ncbi:VOC family protein [Paenimyroides tangerinum]|uniref:VOC family protein n=1 Tax=Paenimyroides tangerinum TaxID=2488728 RepID=A0A3P3VY21_9FLAO|nr:VOC family protein [Paenimyroides tangerinum]RRJ87701.1 VOC family protein [Paenimyroides tangerinum]
MNNKKEPKVNGIGSVMFFTENPKATREWYAKNLNMNVSDWGATFESRNIDNPDQLESTQWCPTKKGSDYFAPSEKPFMINYRVQNIEGLIEQLKANGVTIIGDLIVHEYGKFAHILDEDGNKIELWEPAE